MIDFSAIKDYKLCSKCNKLFPETTEYFHRNKMTLSGLANKCKKCASENRKKYREVNKEKLAEHQKKYYEEKKSGIEKSEKRLV